MYYKGEKLDRPLSQHTDFHGYGEKIRSELAKRIQAETCLKVLDVGTGFGSNVRFLAKHLSKGSKIWTVDPSQEVLDQVKRKFAEEGIDSSPVEFVRANAAKLDFSDSFFDLIVSVMVLHHLEDLSAVIHELVRVLKARGRLLLADYEQSAGRELHFETRHLESDFFNPEEIARIIRGTGVSKVSVDRNEMWYLVDATK